jgi:hypothetical protein
MLPPPPGTCQECAAKHKPDEAHNAQSLAYQHSFYAKRGRWPTWKDAVAHCAPEIRTAWEEELRAAKAWTEPVSEVPDVCPTEDGTIGTVTTIKIEHPKEKRRKR